MNPSKTQNLAKIASILSISLIMSACATGSKTIATDAQASLGTITDKQTIQPYEQRRTSPVDVNVGVGGGGGNIGWGISFGLAQILMNGISSPEVMYRYTVQSGKSESFVVQTSDNFMVNDCVTIWQRPTDATYPRLRLNSNCSASLPTAAATPKTNPK